MSEEKDKTEKGSTARKVKNLQKQYNKILVDLFSNFAPEAIEEALDGAEGSFGENIQGIVSTALDNLKCKVLDELGVKSAEGGMEISIGGIGIDGEPEDLLNPEHEAEETPEEEAEERETGVEDEEEEEEEE